ncbi:MAG TPA: hypothetical protein DIU15_05230 [Deltaproteobacteria bacterium]|nr:hypothetical protein [Deltaproteobacteria bacterium]HCP45420.1 hypothetical protein [Deltaproteobacteria bacterium]
MGTPSGLLLLSAEIEPNLITRALAEQGGPEWDETVFQVFRGVDIFALVSGRPAPGGGMAVAMSSSGWWVRNLDDVADRLSALSGMPALAVFEFGDIAASGYHLARPRKGAVRKIAQGGVPRVWAEGVQALLGVEISPRSVRPLAGVVASVWGNHPRGPQLPSIVHFNLAGSTPAERVMLTDVRGSALVGGLPWKPGSVNTQEAPPPERMRVIILEGPVRLPGPSRWAPAMRPDVIATARRVLDSDGWVCLVPQFSGVVAIHGSVVRLLQLAPLPDGIWLGVLRPWAGVRSGHIRDGFVDVEPVPQEGIVDPRAFEATLDLVIERLRAADLPVRYSESELRASPDPASLLAWQLEVSAELGQTYLASRDPTVRLEVLAAALLRQPVQVGR